MNSKIVKLISTVLKIVVYTQFRLLLLSNLQNKKEMNGYLKLFNRIDNILCLTELF